MERRINDYLNIKDNKKQPYINHYGYGVSMGCGDIYGNGRAFISTTIKEDYNGSDISSYNGYKLYNVNGYMLYITHIHEPWAMGEIIKNDLTTQKCYLGKLNDIIVVSDSIKNVLEALKEEIIAKKNNEEYIAHAFVKAHPNYDSEYDWDEMVFWHSLAEHTCVDGRRKFSKMSNKGQGSKATPKELIFYMKETIAYNIAIKMEELYLKK